MRKNNSLISCSIGNILEWYDFGLFAIFSPLFSQLFFPTTDPQAGLIATFTIFAIGFFCRPIGALFFGYLGDRKGRAKTLRLSILMITLPTLFIGCLPSYQSIGIAAPLCLMIIRIWQGISLGGEYSGNIIYLNEIAPQQHRSFFTSLAASGSNIGILLAMLIGFIINLLLSETALKQWGWRIPYIISGILCLLVYATRFRLPETSIFTELKTKSLLVKNPIVSAFKYHRREMFSTLALVCMGSTFYYFSFMYIPMMLNQDLQFPLSATTRIEACFIACMIILVPLSGYLSDRIGRYRMLLFNAIFITLITIPGYYFLRHSELFYVIAVLFIFTIASSLEQGTTPAILVENFPIHTRYTGISFAYNIANGLLGGSVPLICAWLVNQTHLDIAPAFYIIICSMITLIFASNLYRKVANS